jgi:phosphoglucomutase
LQREPMEIKFGTSGWRALYHEDFNLANVRVVCQAIADEVKLSPQKDAGVIVGYDVRFMGRYFAEAACEVLAGNGIKTFLPPRDVPTPAVSHAIVSHRLAGGINFTASHNPYEYNGIKFSPESGGPALPETTKAIERRIEEILTAPEQVKRIDAAEARAKGLMADLDPRPAYCEAIGKLLHRGAFSRLSGKRIAVDCKYAVARGYLDDFLRQLGVDVIALHDQADPYFGYEHPEPGEGHVAGLQAMVRNNNAAVLGLACDGDADRFGVVDGDGTFVPANLVLALLLHYLVPSRGWKGGVARSVATSHLVDRVAEHHGLRLYETPVGFKYIGDLLVRGEIVFGGEESAGLTIANHLPEKDGILACLLVAEMVAATGKTLGQLTQEVYAAVGEVHATRVGLRLDAAMDKAFAQKVDQPPEVIDGRRVERIDRTDGTKLLLEGDEWVLLRKSGTEPLVRLYAESPTASRLQPLIQACERWLR